MKTIKDIKKEIIIKKSKFICHLYYVNNIDNIKEKLDYINNKYKDATHNCYAYICGNLKKMSDDGEPSGTAGIPILNILETNELDNVLAVVTRYFGGIKLGANGLIRAYADSVKEAIKETNIIELIKGKQIKLTFLYDHIKQIDYLIKNYKIIDKEFDTEVTYILNVPNGIDLKTILDNYVNSYEELKEIYIKKEINF